MRSTFLFVFLSRLFDDLGQINVQRGSDAQYGFQSGISVTIFDVSNHLRRETRFLRDEILGQFSPLALLSKKRDDLYAKCAGVSIHPGELQENWIDSVFHYGGIADAGLGLS